MKRPSHIKLLSDNNGLLFILSISLYILLYYYHGFLIYGGDTIDTVPYALWLSDPSLYSGDFHIQHLTKIFPNERWVISYLLHFFPNHIPLASHIFHAIFSIILVSGLIRLSDLFLKNIEWAALAVFVTLISLYNINIGSNELYYNMFVPSLAAKAVAAWSFVFFYQNKLIPASIILAISTFLHPLVGFQLFVIFGSVILWNELYLKRIKNPKSKRITKYSNKILFYIIYLFTAGIWITYILNAQITNLEEIYSFFQIVKFRIAHHFFPSFFPHWHIYLLVLMYGAALIHFYKKSSFFFHFITLSLFGILIYVIGLNLEYEIVLSSQWMKINIWLKFFAVLGLLSIIQSLFEQKLHRIIMLGLFVISLSYSLIKFSPKKDAEVPFDLYAWVMLKTDRSAVFLVPPKLSDFKAITKRSSYFDFKAMLHHRPEIYEWAKRFESIYGIKIGERTPSENIFALVKDKYMSGIDVQELPEINYFIVPNFNITSELKKHMIKSGRKTVFLGKEYHIYGKE